MAISSSDLPFTSLQSMIVTTGFLVILWSGLKKYINKRGYFGWAETLHETHIFLTGTLSLGLAAYVLDIGHDVLTTQTGVEADPHLLGYLYHLLKIYEYLDIVLSVLAGSTEISKYTAFSTIFLPWWSYFRIINRPQDAFDWRLQVIVDCSYRFLSRAIPWITEDVKTEQTLLDMCEESRWYADLVISAFWGLFMLQGRREDAQALKIFGQPHKDEITAHFLSAAIMLYASQAKRQQDAKKSEAEKAKQQPQQQHLPGKVNATQPNAGSAQQNIRQTTRRTR